MDPTYDILLVGNHCPRAGREELMNLKFQYGAQNGTTVLRGEWEFFWEYAEPPSTLLNVV